MKIFTKKLLNHHMITCSVAMRRAEEHNGLVPTSTPLSTLNIRSVTQMHRDAWNAFQPLVRRRLFQGKNTQN